MSVLLLDGWLVSLLEVSLLLSLVDDRLCLNEEPCVNVLLELVSLVVVSVSVPVLLLEVLLLVGVAVVSFDPLL